MNRLLPAVLAGAFALSGCSALAPGLTFGKPTETTTTAPAQPATQTATETKFEWPKPCDLYDAAKELPGNDFKVTADNIYTCDWSEDLGYGKGNALSLAIWSGLPLERATPPLNAARVTDVTVGAHDGKLYEEREIPGGCQLSLVTADGHVSIYSRAQDVEESCDIAQRVAEKIEPSFP
ncbi:DUF3558 family protein [Lentzea sp. NPDC058450]|uniref:DUF3558 family protein n=1 Tax=Lentzea sp. NPDC058450 TaxID=3346505 RepID=UPI00365A8D7C